MSLSCTKRLCDHCSHIPFDITSLDAASKQTKATPQWNLGSGRRIDASPCPFCRLVSLAFYEHQRTQHSEHDWPEGVEEVVIEWVEPSDDIFSRPCGRGAFSLPLAEGVWICFAAPTTRQVGAGETTSTHEYLLPSVPALLDVNRVKHWIDTCDSVHSDICTRGQSDMRLSSSLRDMFPGLQKLRFVDVEQNCLCETHVFQRYAALSYVWGGLVNKVRLTMASRPLLMKPEGLKLVWHLLPATIKDAMLLCRKLGVRYLWVDALCLLQDVEADMTRGINRMDQIYERSWLTIVAACGHDATTGLPGVRSGSRLRAETVVEVNPGISLGLLMPFDKALERSVYNTRGWTFQESLLARRKLHFVDNKVVFSCRRVEYAESCVDQPITVQPDPSLLYRRNDNKPMPGLLFLATILALYSYRILTNQNDTQRALAGILHRASKILRYDFHEGLPSAAFDAFILFVPSESTLQRREGFPSYSWTGWAGSITVDHVGRSDSKGMRKYSKWLTEHTWIIWYKIHVPKLPNPTLIWDASINIGSRSPQTRDGTDWGSPPPTLEPKEDDFNDTYDGYLGWKPFKGSMLLGAQELRTRPTPNLWQKLPKPISYHLLQFWTVSVFYHLRDIDVLASKATLVGRNKVVCGAIYLDGFEQLPASFKLDDRLEVILLSESRRPICEVAGFQADEDPDINVTPTFYNVMLLKWAGACLERRGIGSIHQSAVDRSLRRPLWKEILLG